MVLFLLWTFNIKRRVGELGRRRDSWRDRQKEGGREGWEGGREGGRESSSMCQFPILIEKLGNDTNHKCSYNVSECAAALSGHPQ